MIHSQMNNDRAYQDFRVQTFVWYTEKEIEEKEKKNIPYE